MTKANTLGSIFDSLANETRRGVVSSLAFRPSTTTQLAKESHISLPGMIKHLNILEKADLVRQQKVGRTKFIALNPDSLAMAQVWLNKFQTQWGTRRETLENYISSYEAMDFKPPKKR
jgi:DNA-binding transcriptional ArsR family regulator